LTGSKAILDAMSWLGLNCDEGPHFQAQRVQLHRDMVTSLLKSSGKKTLELRKIGNDWKIVREIM